MSELKTSIVVFCGWHCESDSILLSPKDFEQFFMTQGELSACKNIKGLMAGMIIRYNLEKWWPFVDSSLCSLKAVLLHKGSVLLSIPVAYTIYKKET